VPATTVQLDRFDGHQRDYDPNLRPALVVETIRALQAGDVEPDIWKIEGLETAQAAGAVVATARSGGRGRVRCIVLGRDAPAERLDHWLEIAASTSGFHGFAIGRSIWEDPLAGHLAGQLTEEQLIDQVADRYLHYVHSYRAAEG
jgi:myo-inositol catabolism protein IolC